MPYPCQRWQCTKPLVLQRLVYHRPAHRESGCKGSLLSYVWDRAKCTESSRRQWELSRLNNLGHSTPGYGRDCAAKRGIGEETRVEGSNLNLQNVSVQERHAFLLSDNEHCTCMLASSMFLTTTCTRVQSNFCTMVLINARKHSKRENRV